MKKKRLKRQNRILLERCQKLEEQRDILLAAYLRYFELRTTMRVSDWIDEQVKRQMRKANENATKN
jgi:aspartyl/asparaginyl beta-hydroxylase (cupin superfamily)